MKKYLLLSVGVLFMLALWAGAYVMAEEEITLDPKLKKHLQTTYDEEEISPEFVRSIEELDVSNLQLASAKGLEEFENVKELDISNNALSDSSFLKELKALEKLDASNNQFEELALGSKNLKHVNVRGNKLSSLDFVLPLKSLKSLNLRSNNIQDISPVEGLSHLEKLNIRGNQVRDLSPLAKLNALKNLNARNNQIHTVEPLVNLPLNKRLYVSGNQISDLALLEDKLQDIKDKDFDIGMKRPEFSEESGVYTEGFDLKLNTEEDYEIYYTLDGSIPNAQSEKYDGEIEISQEVMNALPVISNHETSKDKEAPNFLANEVKKAITVTAVSSYKKSKARAREFSEPISKTYILDTTLFDSELPVISLNVDPHSLFDEHEGIYVPGVWYEEDSIWSGNYAQRGREFEKEAMMEFFDANGDLDFYQDIGFRINGRASRRLPQKSLRLYARNEYGQSRFFTDIFDDLPYNEFNRLLLRQSGQDYNSTMLRDGLMHELVKDEGVDVQAYQPLIVLINGEYWGIHNLREKFNKDYIDIKYNVKNDDLVLMKAFLADDESVDFDMKAGNEEDKKDYHDLIAYVQEHDLAEKQHIEHVQSKIDMDNFLHYVAFQVYYANTDSFSNNLMIWKKRTDYEPEAPKGHDGKWRWMLFDLDWGMGYNVLESADYDGDPINLNMIEHVMNDEEERMALFTQLMENEEVQQQFIEVMVKLLNNNFDPEHVKEKIDELSETIRPEMEQSIHRWDNIESVETWEENLQVLYDFAEERPDIVRQHLMEQFDLTKEDIEEIE